MQQSHMGRMNKALRTVLFKSALPLHEWLSVIVSTLRSLSSITTESVITQVGKVTIKIIKTNTTYTSGY
jgi:hypothetical protein